MNERERLIELLMKGELEADKQGVFNCSQSKWKAEIMADFLLENGVIMPPVKMGERRIDDLGRVHIPKNVRLSLGINYGDVINISVSDASIILRKEREQK